MSQQWHNKSNSIHHKTTNIMAAVTINGVFFTYPDDPCPVFNPAIVSVGHQVARVRVTVNGKAVTYQAYGGDCTIDISSMLQVEFDNLQLGGALQPGMNELGKSVATSIEALDHDGTVLAQLNASIFCVWAALDVSGGEYYVALFNLSEEERRVEVTLEECGAMFPEGRMELQPLHEVWSGRTFTAEDGVLGGDVKPHGVLLLHKR